MSTPPANRMQLLRTKKKRKLAQRGHELLTRKRDALIREFVNQVRSYKEHQQDILDQLQEAYRVLHVAQAVSGVHRVKSLSFATKKNIELRKEEKNFMGVRVDTLDVQTKPTTHNASLIGTSYYVTDAQKQFQQAVPQLIKLAEKEQIILALADEIRRVKRRVNALEHIHLPRIQATEKNIKDRLAEIEREEFTRLKHIKEHGR